MPKSKSHLLTLAFAVLFLIISGSEGTSSEDTYDVDTSLPGGGKDAEQSGQKKQSVVFENLLSEARTDGLARVIVELNVPDVSRKLSGPDKKLYYPPAAEPAGSAVTSAQQASIATAQADLLAQLQNHNISGVKQLRYIPFMALTVDANALLALQASPLVIGISKDRANKTNQSATPSLYESAAFINATGAWNAGYTGAGRVVAILDTGVDKTHSFLAGKVVSEACYSSSGAGLTSLCPGGVNSSITAGSGVNCSVATYGTGCQHGTHVAGIAAGANGLTAYGTLNGIAKGSSIIAIQVFTYSSTAGGLRAYDSDILLGLERVYTLNSTYNVASANMSLGGGRYYDQASCDADSAAMKASIDVLSGALIATVIASGNDGFKDSLAWPACISSAVSVGAVHWNQDVTQSFSNSASFLTFLAPGLEIYSSVPGTGYGYKTGTSMAAPHVAGAWSVLKQVKAGAGIAEIESMFLTTASWVLDPLSGVTSPRINVGGAQDCLLKTVQNFKVPIKWMQHGASFVPGQAQYADVNADGRADLILHSNANDFWVSLSTGTSFGAPGLWMNHGASFVPGQAQYADLNADGRADLILQSNTNDFWVSLSNGTGFGPPGLWMNHGASFVPGQAQYADLNADGRADLILHSNANDFWVSLSNGTSFGPPGLWMNHGASFVPGQAQYADLNADGRADLILQSNTNDFWVSLSTGTSFGPPGLWMNHGASFVAGQAQYADLNGDSRADLILQSNANDFWASLSTGTGFGAPSMWMNHGDSFAPGQAQFADVNNDGMADLMYQGNDNLFWKSASTGVTFASPQCGLKHGGTFEKGQPQWYDVNNDGKDDLIFQGYDNSFWVSLAL